MPVIILKLYCDKHMTIWIAFSFSIIVMDIKIASCCVNFNLLLSPH
jgi:hypothetical protein